jgi:hypothetical protein
MQPGVPKQEPTSEQQELCMHTSHAPSKRPPHPNVGPVVTPTTSGGGAGNPGEAQGTSSPLLRTS